MCQPRHSLRPPESTSLGRRFFSANRSSDRVFYTPYRPISGIRMPSGFKSGVRRHPEVRRIEWSVNAFIAQLHLQWWNLWVLQVLLLIHVFKWLRLFVEPWYTLQTFLIPMLVRWNHDNEVQVLWCTHPATDDDMCQHRLFLYSSEQLYCLPFISLVHHAQFDVVCALLHYETGMGNFNMYTTK